MDNKECIPVLLGFFLYFVNSCVGFSQYLLSGMIVPLVIATYIIQYKIKSPASSPFRCEQDGVWCCLLMLAISYMVEHDGNVLIRIVTPLTLFCYVFTRCPSTEWRAIHYGATTLLTVHSAITSRIFFRDPFSIMLIVVCSVIYLQLLYKLPEVFKKCFTYGELSILLQLYICEVYLVLLYTSGLLKMNALEKLSVIVFVGVHVVIGTFYVLTRRQFTLLYLWLIISLVAVSYIILSICFCIAIDELSTFIQQVILNHTSLFLLTWWILWLVSSLLLVCFYGNKTSDRKIVNDLCSTSDENSTHYKPACNENMESVADDTMVYKQISPDSVGIDDCQQKIIHLQHSSRNSQTFMLLRKYFHVAMLCVYIPGLVFSPSLLYIASVVAAAVLIILEAVRLMQVEPVGSILDEYLCIFLDEQDQGDLILTPIYLMIGCSLPLWWNINVYNTSIQCPLTMYSGLVSVGVGDATASYIGRKYGKHKWPDSKKSMEGTLAAFITQLLFVLLLQYCGISGAIVTMETTLCVLLVSLLEAFTLQIDNLVIPIYAWMLWTCLQPTY